MKLLVITQKVDAHDQLLGFFPGWIKEFSHHFSAIEVLCLEKGESALPDNVKVTSMGKEQRLSRFSQLRNFYRFIVSNRKKYDAVFVHMSPLWVNLGFPIWAAYCKKVFLWYASGGVTAKLRLAAALADGIFTSTSEGFRIHSKKLQVVGQGIDTSLFAPASQPASASSLLTVGRITEVKHYEVLIEALSVLRERGHAFCLDIIGAPVWKEDFKYEQALKERITKHGLDSAVTFVGKINNAELPQHYARHHVYINTSKTGSLDKTILEAMAAGCVVVSSNDAAKKILPQELRVNGEDPIELADAISQASGRRAGEFVGYVKKEHSLENLIKKISTSMKAAAHSPRILIVGYPYIRESYLKTFDFYPTPKDISFVLPRRWPIKGGQVVYSAPARKNILTTTALCTHSNYPIIGGILKGWMPFLPFKVLAAGPREIFYNCSEPTLLSTLYASVWAKLAGMKIVLFSWENVPFEEKMRGLKGRVQHWCLKTNLAFADGVICGNAKAETIFKKHFHDKMARIPLSGVDTDFFHPADVPVFRGPRYIFAGSLSYRKGIHVLLDAFKLLLETQPNAELVIVGSGEYEQQLKDIINNLKLSQQVKMTPWAAKEELRDALCSSDVFVYPSISHGGWNEQFGYSMAEASACGLPVIASRSGSIEEVVKDGQTGILIEENNKQELAQAMRRLAEDSVLSKKLGAAGREYIVEAYSYQSVANKFEEFFKHGITI